MSNFAIPEQHEDSSWHKEDLVAGDELQDVLLVSSELTEEIPHNHEAVGSHCLQRWKTDAHDV